MLTAFSLLIRLILFVISMHIKAICFLIKHFDLTNSLFTSFAVWILTDKIKMPIGVRIALLVLIAVTSFLLQHFFKLARIVFAIIGSFMTGALIYALFDGNGKFSAYIPMTIAMVIAGIVNAIGWWIKIEDKPEVVTDLHD